MVEEAEFFGPSDLLSKVLDAVYLHAWAKRCALCNQSQRTAVGNQSGHGALSPARFAVIGECRYPKRTLQRIEPWQGPTVPRGGLERHWAAVREVIERHPEMTHREADSFAQSIIRYVSRYYGKWFWNWGRPPRS